jgi:uncharacterized protein YqhQ
LLPFYDNKLVGTVFIISPILILSMFDKVLLSLGARNIIQVTVVILSTIFIMTILCALGKLRTTGLYGARYHGAEHMVYNLYFRENGLEQSLFRYKDRFSYKCGSNYLILLLVYAGLTSIISLPFILKLLIWFPFYSEIERIDKGFLNILILPYRILVYFSNFQQHLGQQIKSLK